MSRPVSEDLSSGVGSARFSPTENLTSQMGRVLEHDVGPKIAESMNHPETSEHDLVPSNYSLSNRHEDRTGGIKTPRKRSQGVDRERFAGELYVGDHQTMKRG
ncbi:hypothetical protein LIA77_11604 [Sarocladium implicatum]|nr:hypothetical protein LIA77_11604 [Sarocladium implicatum]